MNQYSNEAALRGEPSYVWREGQQRRLQMILSALPVHSGSRILVDGYPFCSFQLSIQKSLLLMCSNWGLLMSLLLLMHLNVRYAIKSDLFL